jgi:Glycosyl hydrolase family 26/Malectin domain
MARTKSLIPWLAASSLLVVASGCSSLGDLSGGESGAAQGDLDSGVGKTGVEAATLQGMPKGMGSVGPAMARDARAPQDALVSNDAPSAASFSPVRIACGQSTPVTDSLGNAWSADEDYVGGTALVTSNAVSGTSSPALYSGQRYGASSTAFQYAIALRAGSYSVLLKFDESYFTGDAGTGQRLFNVSINGSAVLESFDIYAAAGNQLYTAVDKSFPVTLGSDGVITLDFDPVVQDPRVDAIEITLAGASGGEAPAPPAADASIETDAGGTAAGGSLAATKAAMLSYFASTASSGNVLSGQHWWWYGQTNPPPTVQIDAVGTQTGKYPAIFGVGFDWLGEVDAVALAEPWAAAGGIVFGGSWFDNPATGGSQTDLNIDFSQLLVTGSTTNVAWLSTLDATAAKLQALQSAGVVVMYRPFIELNGNWFWWGNQSSSQFIAVWQQVHDYFVNEKGLNNILWVYNVNAGVGNYTSYYPGDAYVDVVSFDYYGSSPATDITSTYSALATIDRPMMVAEFGCITSNSNTIEPFTCDNDLLISQLHASFPKVFAVAVWSYNWAISEQNGESALMNEPWFVSRAGLPAGL